METLLYNLVVPQIRAVELEPKFQAPVPIIQICLGFGTTARLQG